MPGLSAARPPAFWLYERLGLPVSACEREVREALLSYADEHLVGGREVISQSLSDLIVEHHRDAKELFAVVVGGEL